MSKNRSVRGRMSNSRKVILLLLLFAVLLRGLWLSATIERDEGQFAYAAWLISSNQFSHLTLLDHNTPLIQMVYAGLISLFGNTILPMKLLNHFLFLLSVPFFYKLTERTLGRKTAVAGTLLYALSMNIPAFEGPLAKTTSFATPFMVMGVYFLIQSHFSSRVPNIVRSVLCVIIAFLFRPTLGFGFLLIATDIIFTWENPLASRRAKMHLLKGIALLLALVAAVLSTLVLFIAHWQGTGIMTLRTILMDFSHFFWPIIHLWYPQPPGMFLLEGLFLLPLLLTGLPTVWHMAYVSKQPKRTIYTGILLWFFLSLIVTVLPPMFGYYYSQMVPPLSIIAGVGAIHLANWISLRNKLARVTVMGVLFGIILISLYYQSLHFPDFNSPSLRKRWQDFTYSDAQSFRDQKEIAKFIKEHTESNQTVLIWGQARELLFLSERRAPELRISPLTCVYQTRGVLPAPGISLEETQLFLNNLALGEPLKLDIPTVEFSRHNLERLVTNNEPDTVGALVVFPRYLQFCNDFDKPVFSEMVENWSRRSVGGAIIYIRNNAT